MSDWNKYGIHKGLFLWPSLWVSVAFVVYGVDEIFGLGWSAFGVQPGKMSGVLGILWFPWLHGSLNHLISNMISLFFVGVLIRYSFPQIFDRVWLLSLLLPGIPLWFIGRPSVHIGASAWLYALVIFVFFSGLLRLHLKLLGQSMLMAFLYGSFFWGMLPHDPTISWEGHLSGAIIGLGLALYYRNVEPIKELQDVPLVHEEVTWDDWKYPEAVGEEVTSNDAHIPSQPQQRQQFRYEDGSSPDELV